MQLQNVIIIIKFPSELQKFQFTTMVKDREFFVKMNSLKSFF